MVNQYSQESQGLLPLYRRLRLRLRVVESGLYDNKRETGPVAWNLFLDTRTLQGIQVLGAVGVLLGIVLSYVLFPQAGILGTIAGLLVGYYLTLALVLTVDLRSSWLARIASSSSLVVAGNVAFGLVGIAFGVVGVVAYVESRDPFMILADAFAWACGIGLLSRAWRRSART